jgi:hypothetical protein
VVTVFVSVGVIASAAVVAAGAPMADPIIGLVIKGQAASRTPRTLQRDPAPL